MAVHALRSTRGHKKGEYPEVQKDLLGNKIVALYDPFGVLECGRW